MLSFLCLTHTCIAQSREDVRLPLHITQTKIYTSIKKFVPKDYLVLDQVDGDLNSDGLPDKIIVLKQKKEVTEEEKRPLLLLIKQKDGAFKKVAENDNIVLSAGDGGVHGDPYYGISIKKGFFSVERFGGSGWRWNQVITFKYNSKVNNWYLYKTGNEYWHYSDTKKVEGEYRTQKDFGVVLFADYINEQRDGD